jgi:hypothetical protein
MDTNQEISNQVTSSNSTAAAVDVVPAEPALTPETVVDMLRATRARISEVAPMTVKERRVLRRQANTPDQVLQASINVIGALENVSQAVGQPAADVRQLSDDVNRWTAVEGELREMLNGVAGANLLRRQRIALIAGQAFNIGAQLARDPANAVLVPHLQEVKRLKSSKRRKKAAQAPGTPPSPAPGTPVPKAPSTPAPAVVPFERSDM